jgi:hypothetical protein
MKMLIIYWCWYSALKMEAVCFSEKLAPAYESKERHNPEFQHRHLYRRDNVTFLRLMLTNVLQSFVTSSVVFFQNTRPSFAPIETSKIRL